MFVFVHGAGRAGAAAWPTVHRRDAQFLDLSAVPEVAAQADLVLDSLDERTTVVAHSHGAIPAAMALRAARERVSALVLLEPALYDVARGHAAIERHIATMTAAQRARERHGLQAYWQLVRPLMFGGDFDAALWHAEEPIARRFSTVPAPWGHDLMADEITATPTIVITGGWNDEYDAIADALAAAGARHLVLEGAQHRPQDLAAFTAVLDDLDGLRE